MIKTNLDKLLEARGMSLVELSDEVDIYTSNLTIIKTGKSKAIRFSTLNALCKALNCKPGDLLDYEPDEEESPSYSPHHY